MEQKDQKNQEKNLSELMEFDFDDILMDDFSEEHRSEESGAEPAGAPRAPQHSQSEEAAQKQMRKAKKARRRRGFQVGFDIVTWIKDLAIAAVVFWFLVTFVASSITMPDSSMNPTLAKDEKCLISKIVYRFKEPDRGDVVAFEYKDTNGETKEAISRVVGLPGDTVMIEADGKVTVNNIVLRTSYCTGQTRFVTGEVMYPYTIPKGYYFVLSDNPAGTTDSRYLKIGAVAEEDIFGRVIFCYWPKESWRPIG